MSIRCDFQNSNSLSGKSSPTTPTKFTGVKKLADAFGKSLETAEVKKYFEDQGATLIPYTKDKLADFLAAEQTKMKPKSSTRTDIPVDPADEFACEGCQ